MRIGFSVLEVVVIIAVVAVVFASQFKTAKIKAKAQADRLQKRNTARAKARGGTHVDHDHIKSTELSDKKKLEQLKTLKEAGLLSQEEFNTAWQKVMKEAAAGM